MLAKMGYQFDPEDLEHWEIDAYHLIELTFAKEESKRNKKKR